MIIYRTVKFPPANMQRVVYSTFRITKSRAKGLGFLWLDSMLDPRVTMRVRALALIVAGKYHGIPTTLGARLDGRLDGKGSGALDLVIGEFLLAGLPLRGAFSRAVPQFRQLLQLILFHFSSCALGVIVYRIINQLNTFGALDFRFLLLGLKRALA